MTHYHRLPASSLQLPLPSELQKESLPRCLNLEASIS